MFDSFSKFHWEYYEAMILEDERELHRNIKSHIEYLAMFVNPSAMKKILESRNSKEQLNANNSGISDGSQISSGDDKKFAEIAAKILGKEAKPSFAK